MRSSVSSVPNVTPMVDVMLVLLIIFMVVAPTLLDGFNADPPSTLNAREHPRDSADVTLGIDALGNYFLNKQPIRAELLPDRLRAIYAANQDNHVMFLKADKTLDYEKVLAAIDIARKNGVQM